MARIRTKMASLFAVALAVSVAAALLPFGSAGAASGAGARERAHAKVTRETLERVGTTNVRNLIQAGSAFKRGAPSLAREAGPWADFEGEGGEPAASDTAPSPVDTPVVLNENNRGWEGLDHIDQRFAGGGNQFSLEPPDQGLCVGTTPSPNGPADGVEVVESVNDALTFYDSTTHGFTTPITLSEFYGLPPTINRTTGQFGPFISDPKCYFDPDTERWFHTVLTINQNPKTGDFRGPTFTYIAVSTSSEALGSYYIYRIKASDKDHPNCPCFGDQPLIGADQTGFYISTAEYDLKPFGGHFNGPQIYAMSKDELINGSRSTLVHLSGITHTSGDRTTGTVQPAMSQTNEYDASNGGTEYFLSAYDCLADPAVACAIAPGSFDKITVWALTNTSSLDTASPSLSLSLKDLTVGEYATPVPQIQKDGPRPLGEEIGAPVGVVNANDSRMNQVVFASGFLWSGLNTMVLPGDRDGIEYFIVAPTAPGGLADGTIHTEGYVSAAARFLSFPSIGVNADGLGIMGFSLMGPDDYPSAAQIAITEAGTTGDIEIVRQGFRPEDGFTCYAAFGSDKCRWGDYSAAVGTVDGAVYLATEMISDNSRSYFGNWSTFVWPVTPAS